MYSIFIGNSNSAGNLWVGVNSCRFLLLLGFGGGMLGKNVQSDMNEPAIMTI